MAEKESPRMTLVADYKRVFGTPHGKKVLRHLMKMHGFLQHSHIEGDPYSTAFNEGCRNVVVLIARKLKMDLVVMEEELTKEEDEEHDYV